MSLQYNAERGAMIKEWRLREDGITYYAELTSEVMRLGETRGHSGHDDYAGEVSLTRFLAGEYQDLLRERFGEAALQEALRLATAATRGPSRP